MVALNVRLSPEQVLSTEGVFEDDFCLIRLAQRSQAVLAEAFSREPIGFDDPIRDDGRLIDLGAWDL